MTVGHAGRKDGRDPQGLAPETTTTAGDFLRTLFGAAPPDLHVLLWALRGNRSRWLPVGQIGSAGHLLSPLCTPQAGDVYVGVGLSREDYGPYRRCEADQIAGIVGLWADIDIKGEAHKVENLPETMGDAQELANSLGIAPTLTVATGHGLQPYWLFEQPWIFRDEADRADAADLELRFWTALAKKAAERKWHLDSTHDLARVLRLPGTFNCKVPPAVPVRVLQGDGPRYQVGDFLALLAPPEGDATADDPSTNGHIFVQFAGGVSVAECARRYVAKMRPAISGQRGHQRLWAVALVLIRGFALSREQAWPIIREYSERCEPPWSDKELQHKLDDAEKKSRLPMGYKLDRQGGPHRLNGCGGPGGNPPQHLTDTGNARRLVGRHGQDIRHCHPWKKWLCWCDGRWQVDARAETTLRFKETIGALFRQAVAEIEAAQKEAEQEGEE